MESQDILSYKSSPIPKKCLIHCFNNRDNIRTLKELHLMNKRKIIFFDNFPEFQKIYSAYSHCLSDAKIFRNLETRETNILSLRKILYRSLKTVKKALIGLGKQANILAKDLVGNSFFREIVIQEPSFRLKWLPKKLETLNI